MLDQQINVPEHPERKGTQRRKEAELFKNELEKDKGKDGPMQMIVESLQEITHSKIFRDALLKLFHKNNLTDVNCGSVQRLLLNKENYSLQVSGDSYSSWGTVGREISISFAIKKQQEEVTNVTYRIRLNEAQSELEFFRATRSSSDGQGFAKSIVLSSHIIHRQIIDILRDELSENLTVAASSQDSSLSMVDGKTREGWTSEMLQRLAYQKKEPDDSVWFYLYEDIPQKKETKNIYTRMSKLIQKVRKTL